MAHLKSVCTIKQLEERQLPNEVILMRWSPNMDLLAIANSKGELALHRLTWQRVWLRSAPEEGERITNIAWKPDGKLIAVTYANSKSLCLIDIDNKNILHKTKLDLDIQSTCIAWLSLAKPQTCCSNACVSDKVIPSCTGDYLPPLPNLNRSFGPEPEKKGFLSQTLDMLFLGLENGKVMMYIFGMFYCGMISVGSGPILQISGGEGKVLWASWKNFDSITIVRLSCPLLQNNEAFLNIAQIQSHVECLMDYLSRTLMAISESWETILLEMDEKLAKYAADKPPGSVAADFLELLMIGTPTPDLVNFLLRDLTEKGLKKLGHSIDICYSNIQKLVLSNLSSVGMALVYHFAEMKGMVRYGGPYAALGLKSETRVDDVLNDTKSFLAKSSEVQQVIDHCMRDYKAFIKWLYIVILRLNDERVPPEISKISQQDLTYIAEFLRGFDKIELSARKRKSVNLEKLGQYLREDPLQTCFNPEGSEWASMLMENKCLKDNPLVIKQDFEGSLLQAHANLVKAVNNVFVYAYQDLTRHFNQKILQLGSTTSDFCTQFITTEGNLMLAVPSADCKILELHRINCTKVAEPLNTKAIKIDLGNRQDSTKPLQKFEGRRVMGIEFYSQDYLSLLLLDEENNNTCLIQLSLKNPILSDQKNMRPEFIVNLNDVTESNSIKLFEDISPRILTVSGPRKVVAILSENRRKIRLLETEVDPEEEDIECQQKEDDNMMDISQTQEASTSGM